MELLDMVRNYQTPLEKAHAAIPVLFDDIWRSEAIIYDQRIT